MLGKGCSEQNFKTLKFLPILKFYFFKIAQI